VSLMVGMDLTPILGAKFSTCHTCPDPYNRGSKNECRKCSIAMLVCRNWNAPANASSLLSTVVVGDVPGV